MGDSLECQADFPLTGPIESVLPGFMPGMDPDKRLKIVLLAAVIL
jgi:hypothetical protein